MRLNANEINSGTAHRRHYAWFQLKYWYAGIFLILLNIFVVWVFFCDSSTKKEPTFLSICEYFQADSSELSSSS